MTDKEKKEPLRIEGPFTKEDWEAAQKLNTAEAARLIATQRMTGEVGAEALAKSESQKIDRLSGLLGTDAFKEEAESKLSKLALSRRGTEPNDALVIHLDIKEFKNVNETKGHKGGNLVIKNTGALLTSLVRVGEGDIAGRIGGDEFALMIPFRTKAESEEDRAKERTEVERVLTERLQATVHQAVERGDIPGMRWCTSFYNPGANIDELLDRADSKGETNKDSGRVHEWPPKIEPASEINIDH